MIFFLHGQDSFRSRKKLADIIEGYKKAHKSGLSLIYFDASQKDFADFSTQIRSNSIFEEKKMVILKNTFSDADFQESFLEIIKKFQDSQDIVVIYEADKVDQRTKFFKVLQKTAKCQDFSFLTGALLKKWLAFEFEKHGAKISYQALDCFLSRADGDLWRQENEIKKLANFKKGGEIGVGDIELCVRQNSQNDIFKTIEALAAKNKIQALSLLHQHLDAGDNPLYLLSMFAYQFKNMLILKDLEEKRKSPSLSGLHPFVVKKTSGLCRSFSFLQLKEIYRKIFQADLQIKTGQLDPELAIDLFVAQI
jgi:DNA polymerase-3 subunit delta